MYERRVLIRKAGPTMRFAGIVGMTHVNRPRPKAAKRRYDER
jgi:hypothetical protein